MSYMEMGGIRGGDGGTAKFGEGALKGTLTIEIHVANDERGQYVFLDSIDTMVLREYLKEVKG